MNTQEQSFCKVETEVECNNTPTYIQQSEYYKNRNKPLIYKKKICSVDLLVHSNGKIYNGDIEMFQYSNN